jgi:hypothetical protein
VVDMNVLAFIVVAGSRPLTSGLTRLFLISVAPSARAWVQARALRK